MNHVIYTTTGQFRVDFQNGNTFENMLARIQRLPETRVHRRWKEEILMITYDQHLCLIIILPSYALHGVRVENERGHR